MTATLTPSPATCADAITLTVAATTPPDAVVDFGRAPTGEPHLTLTASTGAAALSTDGRAITRTLRATWLPDLPATTRITGRTVTATTASGRSTSLTLPDIPVTIAAVIAEGIPPELRDILPLPARAGGHPWWAAGFALLVAATVAAAAAWRALKRPSPCPPHPTSTPIQADREARL